MHYQRIKGEIKGFYCQKTLHNLGPSLTVKFLEKLSEKFNLQINQINSLNIDEIFDSSKQLTTRIIISNPPLINQEIARLTNNEENPFNQNGRIQSNAEMDLNLNGNLIPSVSHSNL